MAIVGVIEAIETRPALEIDGSWAGEESATQVGLAFRRSSRA